MDYSCDYYNQYAYHAYRQNHFFPDHERVNSFASHTGNHRHSSEHFQNHNYNFMNEIPTSSVKDEPAFSNCRYNINQSYSNHDAQTENSITPPPVINHTFTNNLSHFDSCGQAYRSLATSLSPNESRPTSNNDSGVDSPPKLKVDDSPALRALLNKPEGKKIVYDYTDLHKPEPAVFEDGARSRGESSFNPNCEDKDLLGYGNNNVVDEKSGGEDNLAGVQNFYPWMKSVHGNRAIILFLNIIDIALKYFSYYYPRDLQFIFIHLL